MGWLLLQQTFFTELEKLKKHINLGCLSNIPPGCGTNKNENLHKQLRSLISRGKLSIRTANSVFSHLFYVHNIKKSGVKYVMPISSRGEPNSSKVGASKGMSNETNDNVNRRNCRGVQQNFW